MNAATIFGAAAISICLAAGTVHAQDKGKAKETAPTTKVVLENDKVRIAETTFKPGEVSRVNRRPRANYFLTNGTLERTDKDGKKTVVERKAGTAIWLEADSDVVRNVGKTTLVLISVQVK